MLLELLKNASAAMMNRHGIDVDMADPIRISMGRSEVRLARFMLVIWTARCPPVLFCGIVGFLSWCFWLLSCESPQIRTLWQHEYMPMLRGPV